MSKMGAKTYSRKTECRTTTLPFDPMLLAEKGNKPSTAKVSVSAVHRWGRTTYTSLRKTNLNGQKEVITTPKEIVPPEVVEPVKRIKVEPQIVHPNIEDSFNFELDSSLHSEQFKDSKDEKLAPSRPNKFFKSGGRGNRISGTISSKKNDEFDALRLSVSKSWNTAKTVDSGMTDSKKMSYFAPVHDKSLLQSAIPLETVSSKLTDPTITTYFSSFTSNSSDLEEKSDNYPMSINDQTPLTEDFLSRDFLSMGTKSLEQKLDIINSTRVKTEYTSSANSVISDLYRNHNKSEKIVSKCDNVSDSSVKASNVEPSKKDICDSVNSPFTINLCSESKNSINDEKIGDNIEEKQPEPMTSFADNKTQVKTKSYSRPKKIFNTSKKPKAVYNHRHWQSFKEEKDDDNENETPATKTSNVFSDFDDEIESEVSSSNMTKTIRSQPSVESSNPVKCYKPMKELYTVVKNVKQAYQCHESGETQEFNDDIEYLLGGLQISNGIRARCLSVLGLSTKCMSPAFRVHLRAHGTMPKIFSALQDAPSDPNLSFCTAALLFVLSQDRLTMDIEASTLSLMLQLLETDPGMGSSNKDYMLEDPTLCALHEKLREKVLQLCEQIQQKGHAKHLKLDTINTGILAMETLLSLTSRKAGEWFKEEIRLLHGLDHIVDTISSCVQTLLQNESEVISKPTESQIDKICKIDRCLRVLENVTYLNHDNQNYLLSYKDALVITCCLSLMKLCKSHLLEQPITPDTDSPPTGEAETTVNAKNISPVVYCLLSVMKLLLNITYENASGSGCVGLHDGCIESVLNCVLQVPRSLPKEKRFDLLVLSLGLMINLVEHNEENRKHIMEIYVPGSFDTYNDGYEILASEALIEVMIGRLESARESEEQADEILSSQAVKRATDVKNVENAASNAECLEETLMKTLQTAGKHMEHSIIAAYISLILGLIIENNHEHAETLKDLVPDGTLPEMVEVLKKFMSFVSLTGVIGGHTGVKSIQRIIEVLNSS